MDQKIHEERIKSWLKENNIDAVHLSFKESCHSVNEAAKAVNAGADEFVKNICIIDDQEMVIVAIVKGEDRVSIKSIEKILNTKKLRLATPEEILSKTGYPCGGTPSFGFKALFLIDSKVLEKDIVYTGGGSENSLIKISTKELQRANNARISKIRK